MPNEKVQEAMQMIEQGVLELTNSDKWKQFLMFQSKFHHYSFHNLVLIFFQKPNASLVAGYKKWQSMGRYVKKGERGIKILAPMKFKVYEDDGSENELSEDTHDHKQKSFMLCKTVTVFDVTQTDGKPLPDTDFCKILEGDCELYEHVKAISPVPIKELDDCQGANGYFSRSEKVIAILSSLPEKQKAKTALHELAHFYLHGSAERAAMDRDIKEIEAESTAYIVSYALGLDTSDFSFGYLATWGNGEDAIRKMKACGDRIQKTANKILSDFQAALGKTEETEFRELKIVG